MKVWLRKTKWQYNTVGRDDNVLYVEGTEYDEGDLLVEKGRMVVMNPFDDTVLVDVSKDLFSKLCTRGDIHIQDPQVRTKQ